jgi:hypothetical protein
MKMQKREKVPQSGRKHPFLNLGLSYIKKGGGGDKNEKGKKLTSTNHIHGKIPYSR